MVWWFQSIEYFRYKNVLDVGTEIHPNFTEVVLMANLGWFLGMAILWRSSRAEKHPGEHAGEAVCFGVGALVFGILYLLMARFSFYFMPLATLWLLFELGRRGHVLSFWTRLPWRGRVPQVAAWILCLLIATPVARRELQRYRQRTDPGPEQIRLVDRQELGRVLPAGAKVVAPWQPTALYMFYAPQARFMNVLDPIFLAARSPEMHQAQKDIFHGLEPDIPLVTAATLDGEYLVFSPTAETPILSQRLRGDPRVQLLHHQVTAVFRVVLPEEQSFIVDWRVVPATVQMPPAVGEEIEAWPKYPLIPSQPLRRLEGFVDARRVSAESPCRGFVHAVDVEEPYEGALEFAPYGPSALWIDDQLAVQSLGEQRAVLGQGTIVPFRLDQGPHRLSVWTCPGEQQGRLAGFYLLQRETR
jgi:hypothetical protein